MNYIREIEKSLVEKMIYWVEGLVAVKHQLEKPSLLLKMRN